jgi:hypothetical protein
MPLFQQWDAAERHRRTGASGVMQQRLLQRFLASPFRKRMGEKDQHGQGSRIEVRVG